MTDGPRRTLAGRIALRRHWLAWGALVAAWFVLVYGGCNWLTARRDARVRVDFDFEREFPIVPWAAYVYLSINPLLWCSGLALHTPRQWRALALAMIGAITIAGVGFLLLPADLAYPPRVESTAPEWHALYRFVHWIVGDHNLFPSLHVALAWLCAAAYAGANRAALRPLWMAWAGAITVATVLAHQHHLLDIAGGIGLGCASFKLIYRRQLPEPRSTAQTSAANRASDPGLPV
jgi:membrane-associated phospholipid phosphatase